MDPADDSAMQDEGVAAMKVAYTIPESVWRCALRGLTMLMIAVHCGCTNAPAREAASGELSAPANALGRPEATIVENNVNWGRIAPSAVVEHEFTILNSGTGPLDVALGARSCSCFEMELNASVVPAGESCRVFVAYRAGMDRQHAGERQFGGYVYTNDPENPRIHFTAEAVVSRVVELEPKSLMLSGRGPYEGAVDVIAYAPADEACGVVGHTTSSTGVTVEFVSQAQRGEAVASTFAVHVASHEGESLEAAFVTFSTDCPDVPFLELPIVLQGPLDPDALAPILLGVVQQGSGPPLQASVTLPSTSYCGPVHTRCSDDRITVACQAASEASPTVTLDIVARGEAGTVDALVEFLDCNHQPLAKVALLGYLAESKS